MPLTNSAVKNAKPKEKSYRLFDGSGMYLEVMKSGSKYWRMKYRFNGKEKRLAIGIYPDLSLKEARLKRDEAKKQLSDGIDPSEYKQLAKLSGDQDSFEHVAREWHTKHQSNWTVNHGKRILTRLEKDVFPWIGKKPIKNITPPELLTVLRRIENRGSLETAHRTMQNCGQVFRYAVATGRAERDPTGDLKGALPPTRKAHLASITDPKMIGELLRAIDSYEGHFISKCAMRVSPFGFRSPR